MDGKITMEITNDKLEEAIKQYAAEMTGDNLKTVLNLLRPTKLYVPAMLAVPDKPVPCFLKAGSGEQFLAVYTSKEMIPKEPKSQALLSMPFPACNEIVCRNELGLSGMSVNPFTDNLVLKKELIEKLHEEDVRLAQAKQVKMTPEQFQVFTKKQAEFAVMPKRLFQEKREFVDRLCKEKEAFVNQIFLDVVRDPKLYPYTESDYAVMALEIGEDLTLIRIDLPDKNLVTPLCYRIYITFNPQTGKPGYYTIEKTDEKDVRLLGGIGEDGKHISYGDAPVEGAELQRVIDLARNPGELMS